ncbi:MAG: tryptophanase [Candidatus Dadabacteria bacterium]|nr:MAG: tryptophanase [Candidatus Dadabacteria bacterium]
MGQQNQGSSILFEPFKIKSVEKLHLSTPKQRRLWIEEAGYNVFSLTSEQVVIDLLTDSGTAAMSDEQWSEMIKADESYAGSRNFLELEKTAREITGMEFILPVHQGRAAEHLLFSTILKEGDIVPSNSHFDTTLANIEDCGAQGINLPTEEGTSPFLKHPFKGNMDVDKLKDLLEQKGERIPAVMMTITNNTGGGQPVSMKNLEAVSSLARQYGKPLIIDACRFAENSYFIKKREEGYKDYTPAEIARKIFSLCDIVTFSGKKDALSNIGGLLCLRDRELVDKLKTKLIVTEGFPTYGGMAGYSLAAMNQGLKEVLDEGYLKYRLRTIEWMVERLEAAQVPVLVPAGGHAIYIEASKFFPHIPRENFPGITLTTELYIRGGIRGCELGTVAFGKRDKDGNHIFPPLDLVRLAVPRRVYTEAHMGYVVECIKEIYSERGRCNGFEFDVEYPIMRHFRSTFKPITA